MKWQKLIQKVISNYNDVLLKRALGLHGAKMPNRTVSTSEHVKWVHRISHAQRLNSSWNSVGFYYGKCLFCICMAADKNIYLTIIFYITQYSNTVVLLFRLLVLWNITQVYWELVLLNFYQWSNHIYNNRVLNHFPCWDRLIISD